MRTGLLLVVGVAAVIYAVVPAMAMPGGWQPIENINDPDIQELGRWAVAEHVKQANDGIKFKKVVKGAVQVVNGFNYRLIIHALNGDGKDAAYKAEVFEEAKPNARKQLVSFSPVN